MTCIGMREQDFTENGSMFDEGSTRLFINKITHILVHQSQKKKQLMNLGPYILICTRVYMYIQNKQKAISLMHQTVYFCSIYKPKLCK